MHTFIHIFSENRSYPETAGYFEKYVMFQRGAMTCPQSV